MLILSGQGNPGAKYAKNRHNAGFMVIDRIHDAYRFGPWRAKFDSEISEGTIDGKKVLLMKPQTFYNETGRAASKALTFYKLQPEDVTVFHDEIDLAPGRLRVKRGGGHSGNNGARSMMAHIGENFRRIRIGVGHPGDKAMVMPHVLSDFHKADLEWFNPMTDAICKALPFLLAGDDERFQTEVMRLAPAPKHDPKQTARRGEA
ncbi:peptidyl-tRNA hydrolase [Hyphomonas polymorpha PS728]|uniref:Peptidyl-tRNA hydrolase n=1 Tax=Hyphomonas polymorpha PS728 TaxID=1280954 RepID=A0A062VCI4_9PROT|nr:MULTISPECIES: aminoacyl-tRNA hydrolase [Hyphomonas]AXE63880.1 aminoacyl-tRNA hydrolase [Hyphomonas sp. CACIAM 19H1]KCZ97972.1 peptidyl-tRNA hydrolase [Hyphomonas polymorpha PS728]